MPSEIVDWEFIYAGNRLWAWRSAKGSRAPFATLETAQANAAAHGFDPLAHYWVAVRRGLITHHQPGHDPFHTPRSED